MILKPPVARDSESELAPSTLDLPTSHSKRSQYGLLSCSRPLLQKEPLIAIIGMEPDLDQTYHVSSSNNLLTEMPPYTSRLLPPLFKLVLIDVPTL